MQTQVVLGIPEADRQTAAELYEQAFGEKFSVAIPNQEERLNLIQESLRLEYAFAAYDQKRLIGVAGFQNTKGSLTNGINARQVLNHLGFWKGLRALAIFILYERSARDGELLMDGISIEEDYRGQGIGSALLNALKRYAKENDFTRIRLDVIDTNPRAKSLYVKHEFFERKTESFEYLRWLLGFGASTTMLWYS